MFMLKFSNEDLYLSDADISSPPYDEDLYDILVRILIRRLEKLVEEGLYKNYRELDENLSSVKGRIMFMQQIRHNLILRHRIFCRYSDLTENVLENQIIKYTLHRIISHSFHPIHLFLGSIMLLILYHLKTLMKQVLNYCSIRV